MRGYSSHTLAKLSTVIYGMGRTIAPKSWSLRDTRVPHTTVPGNPKVLRDKVCNVALWLKPHRWGDRRATEGRHKEQKIENIPLSWSDTPCWGAKSLKHSLWGLLAASIVFFGPQEALKTAPGRVLGPSWRI